MFVIPNPVGAVTPIGASGGPDKPGLDVGAGGIGGANVGAVGGSGNVAGVLGVSYGDKPTAGVSVGMYDGALGRGAGTTAGQDDDEEPSGKGVVVGFGAGDAATAGGKGFPATTATNALCIS